MSIKREHWGSRLGFIMATAGSAIGLGNIWKFPYMAGENGGAAFIIIYLALVFTIGLSVLLAEIMIGRSTQSDAVTAFKKLGHGGFSVVGYMGIAAAFMILSFYCVVAGWTIAYIIKFASGHFVGMGGAELGAEFGSFIAAPVKPILYQGGFVILTVIVVLGGIANGIERAGKILMPLLFVILIALVIRGVTLPGAERGLEFFLAPDFSKITGSTIMAALGQAFFSLSLGMGAILTYGSYLDKTANIGKSASQVAFLDTLVAILAGLAILPAVFAFNMDPGAGPGLTFVTLPAVFSAMPGGYIFGPLFFCLLTIAALTSSVSLLEPLVAFFSTKGFSRAQITIASGFLTFLMGIPCSLSFGLLSDFKIIDRNFFDLMDFLTANLMLPIGGMLIAIFAGWVITPLAIREVSGEGDHGLLTKAWIFILRFVAPIAIALILLSGLDIIQF
ncbi:neurotransmitter:Na+ symporter, NSS family [Cohaesibacter sp. ES.047]|uniref:sodium-dependent transporter n=1 Tax=Cohaesibacter sp. ES.047 TaxID=1798205 RepID=UPI000BB99176|nr:sodium-dependent transporter [Cohaesibacter sp. ES.047]SNY90054.1 neurotransmitter:Na+ symporter, NSS family [Cohaesibacter sp. ES.047]